MNRSRYGHGVTALNGLLYVLGGFNSGHEDINATVFDPVAKSWNEIANMGYSRAYPACTAMDGRLYVCGGLNEYGGNKLSSCELYDPVTNSWTSLPSMMRKKTHAAAIGFDGKIYITGGLDDETVLNSVEVCSVYNSKTHIQ